MLTRCPHRAGAVRGRAVGTRSVPGAAVARGGWAVAGCIEKCDSTLCAYGRWELASGSPNEARAGFGGRCGPGGPVRCSRSTSLDMSMCAVAAARPGPAGATAPRTPIDPRSRGVGRPYAVATSQLAASVASVPVCQAYI